MRYPDARILIFARAPMPGACKTRLIPAVGPRGAAKVQRDLIEKTLETCVASGLAPVEVWCAPDCRHPVFSRSRQDYGVTLKRQPDGDLGRRMSEALRRTLRSARYTLIIGTDCPALTADDLEQALLALRKGNHFVFTPAEDGGYVLVGASISERRLFQGIAWSTPSVMTATRSRLARLQLPWDELPALWDVDTPEDLHRAIAAGLLE